MWKRNDLRRDICLFLLPMPVKLAIRGRDFEALKTKKPLGKKGREDRREKRRPAWGERPFLHPTAPLTLIHPKPNPLHQVTLSEQSSPAMLPLRFLCLFISATTIQVY